jgi:hypothetical protein
MTITITVPEADRPAREVFALTGASVADVVKAALRARLDSLRCEKDAAAPIARMLAIGHTCAQHMDKPFSALDRGDLLYDEHGLPE